MLDFIEHCEEILATANVENIQTITHESIPNIKLQYPEPFIASPSFIHQDLWFMHILVYQYWLWFIFIFIIVFFFLTFLCTVRWCNNRIKPRRETRGVSRSKCGDLITACVPVSWATSIIVSESTDAIDYYDGFGTTELVVGIRAYQWGWEYYYPRDLDLNYNLKKNYSTFVGHSLRYEKSSNVNYTSNNLWKFYKNKNFDQSITPSHLLLLPSDNKKILNFLNFNDVGLSKLSESNAFKKIRIISKSNNSDLYNTYYNFDKKYNKFIHLNNLNNDIETFSFSSKKQFTFLNSLSFSNNNSFVLDYNSLNKFINLNLKSNFNSTNSTKINLFFNNNNLNNYFSKNLSNFKNNFSYLNFLNNDTDKKNIDKVFIKIFTKNFLKSNSFFKKNSFINNFNFENELISSNKNLNYFNNFNNKNFSNKKFQLFSSNQGVSFSSKSIRSLLNSDSYSQFYRTKLNDVISYLSKENSKFHSNNEFFYKLALLNWSNQDKLIRLENSRVVAETPYSPISNSSIFTKNKNYDNNKTNLVFHGKEEMTPSLLTSIYWNFYLNSINNNWRIQRSYEFNNKKDLNYLPQFSLYYDYDFRNWQALELLEDLFWENTFSIYLNDEYQNILNYNNSLTSFDKNLISFLAINSILLEKKDDRSLFNEFFKMDSEVELNTKMNFFFQEDGSIDPFFLNKNNFNQFTTFLNFSNVEESYENFKNYSSFINNFNFNYFLTFNVYLSPIIYNNVLNSFRSDYDDFNFVIENNSLNNQIFDIENINDSNVHTSSSRINDFLNLRNTGKNSIITYNAIQKVFKTRLDEYRSHSRIDDFSSSFSKQSFIDSKRVPYEDILKKNKNTFFDTILYKSYLKKNISNTSLFDASNNFYFFEFPFLTAFKSDSSRYIWFDWFAKWGFFEVQPSSSSKYAIFGMPYFNKVFEYSSSSNENLNETENYFIRIARSRKNYMTNWIYSPFMFHKNVFINKNTHFWWLINNKYSRNSVIRLKSVLKSNEFYWNKLSNYNFYSSSFNYSNSGINTYNRSTWNPQSSIQSYYYTNSVLIDILSKREYVYRLFFLKKKIY